MLRGDCADYADLPGILLIFLFDALQYSEMIRSKMLNNYQRPICAISEICGLFVFALTTQILLGGYFIQDRTQRICISKIKMRIVFNKGIKYLLWRVFQIISGPQTFQ